MPDYRVVIDVRDVAQGDIETLCEEIITQHGESFDAERGDFEVRPLVKVGDSYFALEVAGDNDE